MRMLSILAVVAAILFPASAGAWPVRGVYINQYAKGVINLGDNELVPANTVNILKGCGTSFANPVDVQTLDSYGYPVKAPSGTISVNCNNSAFWQDGTTHYRIKWPATRTFSLGFVQCAGGWTLISGSATTQGCTGFSGTLSSVAGQPGEVDVILTSPILNFPSTGTYATGSGDIAIFRASDEALYNAGQYWTNEFVSEVKNQHPQICRMMGMAILNLGASTEIQWSDRLQPLNMTWNSQSFPAGIMAGGGSMAVSGTNTYTGAAAPDTPGTLTANEEYMGIFANANTSPTVTLNVGGRGAVPVLNLNGKSLNAGDIQAGQLYTVFYDAILGAYLINTDMSGGGINAGVPIEAQAQLANLVGCDLWSNVPTYAVDSYATSWASAVASNLNGSLNFYPEYSNEVWNTFTFVYTNWAVLRAQAMGLGVGDVQRAWNDYYGLRIAQVMGTDIAGVWPGGKTASSLRPVLMFQVGDGFPNSSITTRAAGADLAPSGTSTGTGNAVYDSFTGSANFTVSPNRPADYVKAFGVAPYVSGANLCAGSVDYNCAGALSSANAPFFQSLVNAWESGDTTTSNSLIDNDLRNGLTSQQNVTVSGTTFTTPQPHGFTANQTDVEFSASGGTMYSGLVANTIYRVISTPSSTQFTVEAYVNGGPSGGALNAGTAGTGTTSVGAAAPGVNMMQYATSAYAAMEYAASYFNGGAGGARPTGMGNILLRAYEGALEPGGLTDAQCTALGITSTNDCATDIASAITNWKNSSLALQTEWDYNKQWMGTYSGSPNFGLMTYAASPSELILNGGSSTNVWALNPGYVNSFTPYQTYYGFQSFNTNP